MSEILEQYVESIESENLSVAKKCRAILNKEAAHTLFDNDILACVSNKDICLKQFEFNSKSTLLELIYAARNFMCDDVLNKLLKLIVEHTNSLIVATTDSGIDYLNAYDKHLQKLASSVSNSTTDASRRAAAKKCEHDIEKAQSSLIADIGKDFANVIFKLMDPELIKVHLRECAVSSLHAALLKILSSNKEGEGTSFKLCTADQTFLRLTTSAGVDIKLTMHQDSSKIISLRFI